MMDRPYHPIAIEVVQLYLDRHSSSVGAHEFAQKLAGLVDNPVQSLQADNAALRDLLSNAYHTGWKDAVEDYQADGEPPHKDCAVEGYQNWLANEPARALIGEQP